jgi:hypothetical protein
MVLACNPEAGKEFGFSYASITWVRFNGSFAFRAKLSAFIVQMDGRLAPRTLSKIGRFGWKVKRTAVGFLKKG